MASNSKCFQGPMEWPLHEKAIRRPNGVRAEPPPMLAQCWVICQLLCCPTHQLGTCHGRLGHVQAVILIWAEMGTWSLDRLSMAPWHEAALPGYPVPLLSLGLLRSNGGPSTTCCGQPCQAVMPRLLAGTSAHIASSGLTRSCLGWGASCTHPLMLGHPSSCWLLTSQLSGLLLVLRERVSELPAVTPGLCQLPIPPYHIHFLGCEGPHSS